MYSLKIAVTINIFYLLKIKKAGRALCPACPVVIV